MDTAQFLEAVWGTGLHSVCWLNEGHMRWRFAEHPAQAAPAPLQLPNRDLWFGAHPLHTEPPPHRRGDASYVAQVAAIPADLDWADPCRRTDKILPSEAAVRAALLRLGWELQPSILIHSGHGLQPWWLLDHPVDPAIGAELVARLSARLAELGIENGRQDLASILRLPGSTNWKDPERPMPVVIERFDLDRRFMPEYLRRRVPLPTGWTPSLGGGTRHQGGGAVTDAQLDVQNYVMENHGGHSPRGEGGVIYLWRPGKDRLGGHSATIIVGDQGDAVLTVFSSNWAVIGPDNGEPCWSWVLRSDHLVRAHLADSEELDALLAAGTALNAKPTPTAATATPLEEIAVLTFERLPDPFVIPTIEWHAQALLAMPTHGELAGAEKSLKTYTGLALDVGLAAGLPVLGRFEVPRPQRVLLLVGEGGKGPWLRRWARICAAYGVEPGDLGDMVRFTVSTASVSSGRFTEGVRAELERFEPALVHLDPWYAYAAGGDDSRQVVEVGRTLDRVAELCRGHGASLLINHHFNRQGTEGLRAITGAGHAEWVDSWLMLKHRSPARVGAGEYRLRLDVGSRQWGGESYDLDFDIDPITGTVAWRIEVASPDGEGDEEDAKFIAAKLALLRTGRRAKRALTRASFIERTKGHRDSSLRAAFDELLADGQIIVVATFRNGSNTVSSYEIRDP